MIRLVHRPTPLERCERLDALVGAELWLKRDDCTGGAEAGNKLRKLEHLVADAEAQGADTLLTCGGVQSNHARATAIVAARRGLRAELFLRVDDVHAPLPRSGNVLLDRLVGATLHPITRADYARRNELLAARADALAAEGRRAYVIPEGGSNGRGALGYVDAVREIEGQLTADASLPREFDLVLHACGSGGTAAGLALGLGRHRIARALCAVAVCDDAAYFHAVIERIIAEARALDATLGAPLALTVEDRFIGPGYAQTTAEQRAFLREVARTAGVLLDPVYTGKALYALAQLRPGGRVLFVHTGGLPGLLAEDAVLEPDRS